MTTPDHMMSNQTPSESASVLSLDVPLRAVSVIEHPCIIKNLDKGIASLGGASRLSKALRAKPRPPVVVEDGGPPLELGVEHFVSASLRPDDPFAKRLLATPVTTNNVLLKVTVPKRTGRKRKRGSSGPFLASHEIDPNNTAAANKPAVNNPYVKASTVLQSIKDNETKYKVTPVGVIDESHRFRTLPDLQQSASRENTMHDIKENLMDLRWSKLKNYKFNTVPGPDMTQGIPMTAEFLQIPVHYNFKYEQNHFVKYTDDGLALNVGKRASVDGYYFVECDAESVPSGPKSHMPPEDSLSPFVRSIIADIRLELTKRPIITRHILYNRLGWDKRDRIREAAVYCGYFFASGPFREALIVWGLDPRKDPAFRNYQTISFLSYQKTGTARSRFNFDQHTRELAGVPPHQLQTEHIFDGVTVGHTGNIFMFCDITDALLRRILDTSDIRTTCAPTSQGWFHNGTWAKATVILKDKMNRIIGGEEPDDSLYERILTWPEEWADSDVYGTYRAEMYDRVLHAEKLQEHTIMNTVRWAARNPRYAFEMIDSRRQKQSGGTSDTQDMRQADDEADVEVPEDLTELPDGTDVILEEAGIDEEDLSSGLEDFDDEEDETDREEELELSDGVRDPNSETESDSDDLARAGPDSRRKGPRPFGGIYRGPRR